MMKIQWCPLNKIGGGGNYYSYLTWHVTASMIQQPSTVLRDGPTATVENDERG